MASPLFDPKNRPKAAEAICNADLRRISSASRANLSVISIESYPGLFFAANRAIVEKKEIVLLPTSFKVDDVVYVIPKEGDASFKNGRETHHFSVGRAEIDLLIRALKSTGARVVEGYPDRFSRREVI